MKTLNDYTTSTNYTNLPKIWLQAYEQVNKNENVTINIPNLSTKEIKMLGAIQHYTLNGYREKISIEFPKNKRYELKQINLLMDKVRAYQVNEVLDEITELNLKVRNRAKQLISLD